MWILWNCKCHCQIGNCEERLPDKIYWPTDHLQCTVQRLAICWPTVSVNCWQTVGCLLGHSQATVHGLLAISQLTVGPQPAERVFQRVVLHNYLQLFLGFFFFSICTTLICYRKRFLSKFLVPEKRIIVVQKVIIILVLDLLWVIINFLFSAGYHRRPENFQLGKKSTPFQILYGEQN